MNELQIFNNPEFGSIRTVLIGGEPWFVGKDVALALKYSNARDALQKHVDEEDKQIIQKSQNATLEDVPNRGLTVINESGLYSLILSSKLPNAKKFKRWVTAEVLPTIRRTGSYALPQVEQTQALPERQLTADDYLRAASIISVCRNERLPYVLNLIKQSGITVPYTINAGKTDKDISGECARLINKAHNEYGMSLTSIGRLVGLQTTQITRIRSGESVPTKQRSKIICDALRMEIPEIE